MRVTLLVVVSFLLFLLPKCKNGTGSDQDDVDTTSHNFTWRIDTLGKYLSYLNDVTIINENYIIAGGEINTDSGTYNLAIWDGENWHLEVLDLGQIVTGIFNKDQNNIWYTTGVLHLWSSNNWRKYHLWRMNVLGDSDGAISAIWGGETTNMYFAGEKGTIVTFDGIQFRKMESLTNIELNRISGNVNGNVFITGYELSGEGIALELVDDEWVSLFGTNHKYGRFKGVWCGDKYVYLITTEGILKRNLKSSDTVFLSDVYRVDPSLITHEIEGQAENDIAVVSNRGKILHWNGASWSTQYEIYNQYPDHILSVRGADYSSQTIAFVGYYKNATQAFIVIGTK